MRAEILPAMWPRYRISGYERLFHYRLLTVIWRAMVIQATCHDLTPASVNSTYPPAVDEEYRVWINERIHVPGGHPDRDQQLVTSASECAMSILASAGAVCIGVTDFNAYQLDLFLFKDMGLGGVLSKFIGRMNDLDIGGIQGLFLSDPVSTWYQSFFDDYVTYLKVADCDAVLAPQIVSPGTQVTIMFIAIVFEEAEYAAQSNNPDSPGLP